jgi:hypothetical protein
MWSVEKKSLISFQSFHEAKFLDFVFNFCSKSHSPDFGVSSVERWRIGGVRKRSARTVTGGFLHCT